MDMLGPACSQINYFNTLRISLLTCFFIQKIDVLRLFCGVKLYDHQVLEIANPDSIDAGLDSTTPLKNVERLDYRSISGLSISVGQMLTSFNRDYH